MALLRRDPLGRRRSLPGRDRGGVCGGCVVLARWGASGGVACQGVEGLGGPGRHGVGGVVCRGGAGAAGAVRR
jgi:hypothetical protein